MYIYHVRLFGKITSFDGHTVHFTFFFMWKFISARVYTVNIVILLKPKEKPEKDGKLILNYYGTTAWKLKMFTSSPICCLSWSFMKKIAGLTVPPKSQHCVILCIIIHPFLKYDPSFLGSKPTKNIKIVSEIHLKVFLMEIILSTKSEYETTVHYHQENFVMYANSSNTSCSLLS